MQLDLEPVHPQIGMRVRGLDLRQPLDSATTAAILDAFARHQLLIFPDQELDEAGMLAFTRHFGEPEIFVDPTTRTGSVPQVIALTNLDASGKPFGPGPQMARLSLAENWHSDSSYRKVRALATFLHGVVIPAEGGDTQYASLHAAYDALPDDLKARIEPLAAIHNWEYQRTLAPGRGPMSEGERATAPPVAHRLVERHPVTGRKLLFLSSSAEYIEGLPYEEGRALLRELTAIATRPEAVYTHKWTRHELLAWDNRATLHRSAGFDYQSLVLRRKMNRVVVGGDAAMQ